jgi:23S rRNA (uridine2552-2'-O)-methyltransferase
MPSSSSRWLKEHFSDPYVKDARAKGYRSRAVYKLLEIHRRDYLFKPGMTVLELGAAPGSWSQGILPLIQPRGRLIAVDILPMEPIPGVEIVQGDFTDEKVLSDLLERLKGASCDWVLSDMAPNMSGLAAVDIPRAFYLAELAVDCAVQVLNEKGGCLIKVFQGEGFDAFRAMMMRRFQSVVVRKPKASRDRSREMFILGRGIKK